MRLHSCFLPNANTYPRCAPVMLVVIFTSCAGIPRSEPIANAPVSNASISNTSVSNANEAHTLPKTAKPRPTPEESSLYIKKVAQEEGSKFISKPVFSIDTQTKKVLYNFGRVETGDMGLPENNPYRYLIQEQIHIEALAEAFSGSSEGRDIIENFRKEAEALIYQTLVDLQTSSANEELQAAVTNNRTLYQSLLERLKQDILTLAAAKGFEAVNLPGIVPAIRPWKADIVSDPPGGTIRLMTYFAYRQYQYFGGVLDDYGLRLAQAVEYVIGDYYYVVNWPDGTNGEGRVAFAGNGEYKFPPGSR